MQRRDFILGMLCGTAALAVTRTAVAQPMPAGAMPTGVYLNMATKGGLFLENTARDANAKTRNPRVKAFSRAEVIEQVTLANRIDAYTRGGAPAMAGNPPPGGVVGGLVAAPFAVAGGAVTAATGIAGGVVGGVLGGPGAPAGGMAPGGMTSDAQKQQILGQLASMQGGPRYDAMFVNASLQGHQEALAIHGGYAQSGEDPELRRIARGALPLIHKHIAMLSRMQRTMGGPAEG